MNPIRAIRERLGVTQAVLGEALGVTQGNVSFYERGQTVPPDVAGKLIEYARSLGMVISYDHIYGAMPLEAPPMPELTPRKPVAEANGDGEPHTAIALGVEQRSKDREVEDLKLQAAIAGRESGWGDL